VQKFEIASVALDLSREIAAVLTQNIGMAARELAAMNREIGASLRKFAESPEAILFSDRSTADEKMVAAAALAKRLPIKPKNPAARAALMRLAKQRGKRLTKMAPRKWRGGEEFAEWVRSEVLVPAVLRAAKDAYVSQPVRIGKDWIGGSSKFEVVPMKLPVQLAWIWLR